MMRIYLVVFIFFVLMPQALAFDPSQIPREWPHCDGKHFDVVYPMGGDVQQATSVLTKAEEYYDRISYRLGFSRYQDYWTWEKKVKIILYPNAQDYAVQTGQPGWSEAFSSSHAGLLGARVIVSYVGQDEFLSTILPHEIGHLILHDFMNNRPIPVFFDEGVAQLEQGRDDTAHTAIMAGLVKAGQYIPFSVLMTLKPNEKFNQQAVSIFYAESLYIVDFLIKTYGRDNFVDLCRALRDGVELEEAIKKVYYPTLTNVTDLEKQWVASFSLNEF